MMDGITAVPSKNTVSAIVRTSIKRQIFWWIYSYGKRLYVHVFDMVDTAFSYGRALIVC